MPFNIMRSGNFMMSVDTLVSADLSGLDLRCADFQGMDMTGCNLRGSDLRGAMFMRATLDGADMRDCQMSEHHCKASLRDALLDGATIDWRSHELVSELLRRAAQTPAQAAYAVAGLARRDGCYPGIVAAANPELRWAIATLLPYVTPGDNAPAELTR
jgi:uncharacterized protein YjbI with pentapeptide repeats